MHVADRIIIAGYSNVASAKAAVPERIQGDKRVKVAFFPGKTMQALVTKAKGQLAMSS